MVMTGGDMKENDSHNQGRRKASVSDYVDGDDILVCTLI